jgi:MoxR-like ATPase
MLFACGSNTQDEANKLLEQANKQFESHQYDKALASIDSLRRVYPGAIDTRKKALALLQAIELKRTQEELAIVDSTLEVVKQQYASMQQEVEQHKAALKATPEELTALTRLRMHRDSLQVRFDALCNQIKYIHQLQNKK